ncbi:EF-hand domain pair [Arabidopsis thaliana x Arabidopsis arenosa]|uniref:EF-hand domain pair n=1 Tax=Arabidopsis thaliana x Arabidopsis arenosa TaxID=1240361 RepID=A0A8T2A7H8_9BRAS|nr:EF-hand domain pair [Arabidopsis thaliana x Arabidopsis arenosa]
MAGVTLFFFFLSIALIISGVSSRVLSHVPLNNSILISDGVHDALNYEFLTLDPPKTLSRTACVHVYGFLPCADNVEGYIFQVFSFGCLLIIGDYFLSEGRSKLFLIFEVGFYGGIIFPLLTMFPRIALMLSTGLSLSRDVASSFIDENVGVTVGHTVFSLTIQWGACVVFSITGPRSHQSVRRTTTDGLIERLKILKGFVEARVEADPKNKKAAGIMLLSLAPFLMVTLSAIFDSHSWSHIIVLITLIISSSSTVIYFVYSYLDTANQEKSLDHARFELMSEVHKHLKSLFKKTDKSKDGKIQISELKDLTIEFSNFGRMKYDINELAKAFLEDFDGDKDGELEENEFEEGIARLLKQYKFNVEDQRENQTEEHGVLKMEIPKKTLVNKLLSMGTLVAAIEVIAGILIVLFLAKPFMMNIQLLSISAGIPSIYIVFAMVPFARNLKNTLSTRFCRGKDKKRISSNTFSEIYKDVTMNNLMGMSIILAIVYTRGLTWKYSVEALIMVIVGLIIGLPVYMRSTYPFWMCVLAFAMYFFSLFLIYLRFHFEDEN